MRTISASSFDIARAVSPRIVLFGATGYTGELVARALVERGARPLLAARSQERLAALADELGGLETQVADVSRPESVRALVEPGDVLLSTVGPFGRWGGPAVEAAIDAGATYIDSTGEPAFIRRVFEEYGSRAVESGCTLLTAFGYDWVPGNLAGALALRDAGSAASRVEIGYFSSGGGTSGGTQASAMGALLEPSFAFRDGRLGSERSGARVDTFELPGGKHRRAVSVGGSEHFTLPPLHPELREVDVLLGMAGGHVRYMPAISGAITAVTKLPPARAGIRALLRRQVKGSTGGPDAASRKQSSSTVKAVASSADGEVLSTVTVEGVNPYTFTGEILAWGAMTAADVGVSGAGALGPVAAFGLDELEQGVQGAGISRGS